MKDFIFARKRQDI